MATKLTTAAVLKYTPHETRREIADTTAGLHLIIQPKPSGTKSWALRFRRPDGRPAKLTLGPLDTSDRENAEEPVLGAPLTLGQARELAIRIHRERARGVDVVAQYQAEQSRKRTAAAAAAANTFAKAVHDYSIHHTTKWGQRPRRWRDDARLLGLRWARGSDPQTVEPEVIKGSLVDSWGDRPVTGIDAEDIVTAVDDAIHNGIPGLGRANEGMSTPRGRKMHAALSGVFRWLKRRRRVAVNPCTGVWRPGPPQDRNRKLTDDEIRVFWHACEKLHAPYKQLFRLLLLTGCRREEAARIRHDEIVDDMVWLPAERTKNHIAHDVPLSALAREQFEGLPRIEGRDMIFAVGPRAGAPGDFSRAKKKLDEEMTKLAERTINPWRLHDLRRTCASGLQQLGVRHEVIEKALNHVSGAYAGVAGIYQRAELLPERREALQRWSDHIAGLLTDRSNVVTALKRRG